MTISSRSPRLLVWLIALSLTACDSPDVSISSSHSATPPATQSPADPAQSDTSNTDMSAHALTIHKMTTEMVNLMDDVNRKEIMSPPLPVSDVRNAFFERLDWLNDMTPDDLAKLRQATADLDALIAEIRAHPNAAGDAELESRLKKIEDWNRSIEEGIPQ